jgi:hypothetical protein
MSRTVIAQGVFVDDAALAFLCDIGHPDASNSESVGLRSSVNLLPKRLV